MEKSKISIESLEKEIAKLQSFINNSDQHFAKIEEEIHQKNEQLQENKSNYQEIQGKQKQIEDDCLSIIAQQKAKEEQKTTWENEFASLQKEMEELKQFIGKIKFDREKVEGEIIEVKETIRQISKQEIEQNEERKKNKRQLDKLFQEYGFIETIKDDIKKDVRKSIKESEEVDNKEEENELVGKKRKDNASFWRCKLLI